MARRIAVNNVQYDPQIKSFAFTVLGHAMADDFANRTGPEIIVGRHPSTRSYEDFVHDPARTYRVVSKFDKNSIITSRELRPLHKGVRQYLVVGYTLRDLPTKLADVVASQDEHHTIGTKAPNEFEACSINWWGTALVVVEMVMLRQKAVQLFAMASQKEGLCTPYPIKQENVFYRSEYRTSVNDSSVRGEMWNAIIAQHPNRPGIFLPAAQDTHLITIATPNTTVIAELNPNDYNLSESDQLFIEEFETTVELTSQYPDLLRLKFSSLGPLLTARTVHFKYYDLREFFEDFRSMWPDITRREVESLYTNLRDDQKYRNHQFFKNYLWRACLSLERKRLITLQKNVVSNRASQDTSQSKGAIHRHPILVMILSKLREMAAFREAMEEHAVKTAEVRVHGESL